jgi:hypothetical protein
MGKAAQGRAAGVRIGAGSVPVKDRYWQKSREKRQNSCGVEPKKNAASDGALRRVEKNISEVLREVCDQEHRQRIGRRSGMFPPPKERYRKV